MLHAALIRAAQNGDADAKAQVIEGLEGMIYRLAEKRMVHTPDKSSGYGDKLEDLRQEGRVAVLEALASYDPEGGAKFSTYAHHRIQGAIWDGANTRGTTSISADAVATFKACLGIVGADWEAAEYLVTVLPGPGHRLSPAAAHLVRLAMEGAESLDAPVAGEETILLGETLVDPYSYGVPDDPVQAGDLARRDRERKRVLAHALLAHLHGNADRIVRMVYGFDPEPHLYAGYDSNGLPVPDHAEIAAALGITVATSRQTLKRALDCLRAVVETLELDQDQELAA
ncbi:sigma-70 family RNA polymerase sigma factor [Streptomyces sp. URMC 124]|uniref:sigma-70 family RNA polymerase sigma factor n=1 Tax=Streptomyces sp. URMC 124 TaxID=3423405 RepID=UPI003F1B645A